MTYPKGNAQIGDKVWYRSSAKQPWTKDWKVVKVGLKNAMGYPLDIQIERTVKGRKSGRIVSPYFNDLDLCVVIIPQNLPNEVRRYIKRHPNLVPVRDGVNNECIQLMCLHCETLLHDKAESIEVSELRFTESGWASDKPELISCEATLRCGCPSRQYDELDFDSYY